MKLRLRARYFEGTVVFEFKPVSSDPAPSAIPHWPQSLSRTSQKTILITSWSYSGKTVCFYSLHFFFFFQNVPNARSPEGISAELKPRSSMEKLRLTQVKTHCLLVPESPCQKLKSSLVELCREAVLGWAEACCLRESSARPGSWAAAG